ncbi:hypothetical protein QTP88_008550 [Uroleucon formosanum]
MRENTERVCIKFCHKLGKTAIETYQMLLLAYGDETISRARVFEWFKRFKEGRTTVESDEREGRPSTNRNEEMIQKIRTAIRGNRRLIIMELSNEFQISFGSVPTILMTDLDMSCSQICSKTALRLGYMATIQKQRYNLHSGRHLIHHDPKKLVKFGVQ